MTQSTDTNAIREGTVEANGIRFRFLEAGEGPLVLLLHGFPDDAWSWSHQVPALADAGYRVVAPFMRGYPPTEIPSDGRYDMVTLGRDLVELIQALDGSPANVVGHDWGAVATYGAVATNPDVLRRVAVIAIGHPATFAGVLATPAQAHHAFHIWYFQLEGIADVLRGTDLAIVDYLWQHWSPDGGDDEHIARVKRETLAQPGALEAALSYYRDLSDLRFKPDVVAQMTKPSPAPTLAIFGANDPVRVLSEGEETNFTGPYRREIVEGAAHFVQRERPEEVTRLLLDWIADEPTSRERPRASAAKA
jgi:pimeloyl-ACP methyl ester carboxylesterase